MVYNGSSALAYDTDDKSNVFTVNFELGFKADDFVYRYVGYSLKKSCLISTNVRRSYRPTLKILHPVSIAVRMSKTQFVCNNSS